MKVAGIIAEYNPFHRGHQYHIRETRRLTGADYVIIVMSGNFTQRGQAALMDKYSRAKQALENGADLVLELPVFFSTGSANFFACGALSLLEKTGVVDYLSFGSEEGCLEKPRQIASFLQKEPDTYRKDLQTGLKQGLSFPKARALALEKNIPGVDAAFLTHPNNILGIEYCNALLSLNSSIKPITIKRLHGNYHDAALSAEGYSSATAIRQNLKDKDLSLLKNHLPFSVYEMLRAEYGFTMPVKMNDFSGLLHYRLLMAKEDFSLYADVHKELADRICNQLYSFKDYASFCDSLKTKELTHSRISRSLLHILLDMKEEALQRYKAEGYSRYGRILGFRRAASPLLHQIKVHSCIPLISKLADSASLLDSLAITMLETDIRAAHIYESVLSQKFSLPFRDEYRRQFPIL